MHSQPRGPQRASCAHAVPLHPRSHTHTIWLKIVAPARLPITVRQRPLPEQSLGHCCVVQSAPPKPEVHTQRRPPVAVSVMHVPRPPQRFGHPSYSGKQSSRVAFAGQYTLPVKSASIAWHCALVTASVLSGHTAGISLWLVVCGQLSHAATPSLGLTTFMYSDVLLQAYS